MSYIVDLENKVKDYMHGDYEIVQTDTIPSPETVAFGKKAYKINLTAFCIDLRKSTELLRIHDKETCGKIHKSFLTIATKVIIENGGQLRSFNGDSVLAFWPAKTKQHIQQAVQAAFQLKWALSYKFAKYFDSFTKLDYGIGIDWGTVYIVRAGLPKNDNNNDLVFLGMCVNYSNAIANQGCAPHNIEISENVYSNLNDAWLYGMSNGERKNMWTNGEIMWKGTKHLTKCTSWHQEIK